MLESFSMGQTQQANMLFWDSNECKLITILGNVVIYINMATYYIYYLIFVGKLVLHNQVMIDKGSWGGVCIPELEVKFDDL